MPSRNTAHHFGVKTHALTTGKLCESEFRVLYETGPLVQSNKSKELVFLYHFSSSLEQILYHLTPGARLLFCNFIIHLHSIFL